MSRSAVPARRRLGLVLCLCLALPPMRVSAQAAYDKGEFAARRERLLAGMPDGIAVILGGQAHEYPVRFRQSPDLYYLTGLEEPGLVLVLNGVTKKAAVFALKRPKFGAPDPTPDLRDVPQPVETYGLPVQPMESFFAFLTFAAWNPAVQKLYVQLTPPDDLLHSRGEARAANAIAMDHPVLGHEPPASQAIERIHSAVPHLALADVSPKLDELRWVKTAYEVAAAPPGWRHRRGGGGGGDPGHPPRDVRVRDGRGGPVREHPHGRPGRRVSADRALGAARADRPLHGQHAADAGGRAGLHGLRLRLRVLHLGHHPHVAGLRPVHRGAGEDVPLRARGAERHHRGDEAGSHASNRCRRSPRRCTRSTAMPRSSRPAGGTSATSWGSRCTT